MSVEEFRSTAHELVDWMADFLATIEERPVRAVKRAQGTRGGVTLYEAHL